MVKDLKAKGPRDSHLKKFFFEYITAFSQGEGAKGPRVLQLQTIKAIINSRRFKSSRSDEPRRMQVLVLLGLRAKFKQRNSQLKTSLENNGIYPTLIY